MKVTLQGTHEKWELLTYTDIFSIVGDRKAGEFNGPSSVEIDIHWSVQEGTMTVWCEHGSWWKKELGHGDMTIGFVCPISEREYSE